MTDLEPLMTDVNFPWGLATRLSAAFRSAASELSGQIPRRNSMATHAKEDWHGAYARRFDGHMTICTGDAAKISAALEEAAATLDELAQLAREEQARRDIAQAWKIARWMEAAGEHDAWEREQSNDGLLENTWDGLAGDDEPKPPDLPVKTPPTRTISSPVRGGRG